ncbi:cysteine proteinase [Lentinula novae-zelandiae]|nr:cysteine proteinase [Lentinula novae-zelandiae]
MTIQDLPSVLDSPTSVSSVSSSSTTTISSRKRQRSTSANSATEESLKRGSPRPQIDPLSIGEAKDMVEDSEMDSYMQEQGHIGPSSAEKLTRIAELQRTPLALNQTWFLVDRAWCCRWRAALGEIDPKSNEATLSESQLGPPSISALIDEFGNLKPGLVEDVDFELFPNEAWSLLVSWYGEPPTSLRRNTIARGYNQSTIAVELHPPKFYIFRLTKEDEDDETYISSPSETSLPATITLSAHATLKDLHRESVSILHTGIASNLPQSRLWRLNESSASHLSRQLPVSKFSAIELLDITINGSKTLEEALFQSQDSFALEFQDITTREWLVKTEIEETTPEPLFKSNDAFFNRMSGASSSSLFSNSQSNGDARAEVNEKLSVVSKKEKPKEKWIEPGTLGLGNMGNTCFMNSAIQCLGHQKELTEYFLTGVYSRELNPDNPLGMGGAIAEGFGALLTRMWAGSELAHTYGALDKLKEGSGGMDFKSQLSRFAPQFSGYQQHDSQELVAFLLDGLHEDLNRVLKKPYVEKPDWFGAHNKEMLRFARESWEGYKQRNDSVIVDLFQGQYRSTLVCPECQKISITFDPFMYLTLPLPVQKKWRSIVYYVPWDMKKPHLKVPIEIGRDASFKDLRALLGRWVNAPPENLLTLEYFSHHFYKNLDDSILCGEIGDNDTIICFELPCNSQQSRTWKRSDHPNDPWVLPLLLCDAPPTSFSTNAFSKTYGNHRLGNNLFGYPTIVVVTAEQAKSVEGIYGAAVERLARWTRQERDLWTWELPDGFPISVIDEKVETVTLNVMDEDGLETVTEISEDGAVPTPLLTPEEGDIVDEKSMVLDIGEDTLESGLKSAVPIRLGPKKDIFTLRLSTGQKDYGTSGYTSTPVSWESRIEEAEKTALTNPESAVGGLLKEHDVLYCEFDENMKSYYFGEERSFPKYEHALWEIWDEFLHPEYQDSVKSAASKSSRGISLSDCLDEFTKEEQLGADDLWYCPQCKKHQQATKKFDLWSTPDVLVVHLKRFSNSRMLRDKIDAFVDFPILGLDMNERVNERRVISSLERMGVDTNSVELLGRGSEAGSGQTSEPLIYDLFAVDEHLGGLGGGHYRAYAFNHMNNKWYHFDDSFVSESTADNAVNANAYLLFYRRRSSSPLGGQSHVLVEQVLRSPTQIVSSTSDDEPNDAPSDVIGVSPMHTDIQLPTPPSEVDTLPSYLNDSPTSSLGAGFTMTNWQSSQSSHFRSGVPTDDEGEYEQSPFLGIFNDVDISSILPPSSLADSSPSSSVGVEPDFDADLRSDDINDLDAEGEDDDDEGPWSSEARARSMTLETEGEVRETSPAWSVSAHSASQRSSEVASPDD